MTPPPEPRRLAELLAARELGLLDSAERAELDLLLARDEVALQPDIGEARALLRDALHGETAPPAVLRALHGSARASITRRSRPTRPGRAALAIAATMGVISCVLLVVLLRTSSALSAAQRREREAMSAIMLDPRANQRLLDQAPDTIHATLTVAGETIATVRWSTSLQRGVLGVSLTQSTDPSRERLVVTLIASDGLRTPVAGVDYVPVYSDGKQSEAVVILAPSQAVLDAESIELAIEPLEASARRVLATARLR